MRHVDTLVIVSDATSRGIQTAALIRKMVQNEGDTIREGKPGV
jgi:CO dehydrogenase nickel-insertion accessory protein CooC1